MMAGQRCRELQLLWGDECDGAAMSMAWFVLGGGTNWEHGRCCSSRVQGGAGDPGRGLPGPPWIVSCSVNLARIRAFHVLLAQAY